jgi:hypothetical protein
MRRAVARIACTVTRYSVGWLAWTRSRAQQWIWAAVQRRRSRSRSPGGALTIRAHRSWRRCVWLAAWAGPPRPARPGRPAGWSARHQSCPAPSTAHTLGPDAWRWAKPSSCRCPGLVVGTVAWTSTAPVGSQTAANGRVGSASATGASLAGDPQTTQPETHNGKSATAATCPRAPWRSSPKRPTRRWRPPNSCQHRLPTLTRTAAALTPRRGTSPRTRPACAGTGRFPGPPRPCRHGRSFRWSSPGRVGPPPAPGRRSGRVPAARTSSPAAPLPPSRKAPMEHEVSRIFSRGRHEVQTASCPPSAGPACVSDRVGFGGPDCRRLSHCGATCQTDDAGRRPPYARAAESA